MTRVYVDYEELWVPWHIGPDTEKHWPVEADLPDDLVDRFEKAKAEIDAVWNELKTYEKTRALTHPQEHPEVAEARADNQAAWIAYRDTPDWRRIRKERRWRACDRTYKRFIALWREHEQTQEDSLAFDRAATRWVK